MKAMPTQPLPADSFYEYVPSSDDWVVKKKSANKVLSKKDIKAYESGWPSQEDSVTWGAAAPNTYSDEPNINHDYPLGKTEDGDTSEPKTISDIVKYYIENPHDAHGTVIDINTSDRTLKFEDGFVISFDDVTNIAPKPDRGSDAPEVNDYSQNYFFGPTDLGKAHQHSPADYGWSPAGTEDMDGPSSNVRMSSFSKFMQKTSALHKSALTKNYALYIGGVLATRTITRSKAEKILRSRFPEQYAKGNYEIRQEQFTASLSKKAHCGPCSVIKAEVLKMLADLKYKDSSVNAEDLKELALYSSDLSNYSFIQYLGEVIDSLPKEHEKEAQKLKNHKLALEDIQKRIDDGDMVADKPENKKEASSSIFDINGVRVYKNPAPEQAEQLYSKSKEPSLRYYIDPLGDLYMWDAWEAEHETIVDGLGYEMDPDAPVFGQVFSGQDAYNTAKNYKDFKYSVSANLNLQANPPTRFWYDPSGKEFPVAGVHGAWIKQNPDILKKYGIKVDKNLYNTWLRMKQAGWVRVSNEPAGTGFQIEVNDVYNIPKYVDDIIAKYFKEGDTILIGEENGGGFAINDPFPTIQKAVNRELRKPQLAASKKASILDEVLSQETQNEIAGKYGPQFLIAMRFYNDAMRYGQNEQRSLAYAIEETNKMGKKIDEATLVKVLQNYFY